MIGEKDYYLDTFHVSLPMLRSIMDGCPGNYADMFFESTAYYDLMLRDSCVSSGGMHVDFGVGIRVLDGDSVGYAYSESTGLAAMQAAAKSAGMIASGSRRRSSVADGRGYVPKLYGGLPNPAADRYPIVEDWRQRPMAAFVPILEKLEGMIRKADSRAVKIIEVLSAQTSDILMYNSLGELKYETRPMGTLAVSAIFQQGGKTVMTHNSLSFRSGAEMIDDSLLQRLTDSTVSGLDAKFEAVRPKGGKMPVVMGAGASGILLHEAMGHAFEADFNRKGQSIFAGKIGRRVCSPGINIVDDATIRGNRGSLNYDDDGVPGQRTCMVRDGILESYLHDRISAAHFKVAPTGNGRRENFRYAPLPRMRATYMESGSSRPEDIIASVQKGIYVDEFSNGQVKIGEGDFTFYVKSGYLIERGRLTQPVKDINIIGNGPQALADIVAVGNDCIVDPGAWTCGKEQSCPVSCGIPTVLVENMIVGGGE